MLPRQLRIAAVLAIALSLLSPQSVRAQGGGAGGPVLTVRGCELVLHARNTSNETIIVDIEASQAQKGSEPWGTLTRGAFNQASAMTFTLPANAQSTRHTLTTWIDCNEKQRYKFSVRRGSRPAVMVEFPSAGAYTTDKSLRLGDLAAK
jgi:hypothetical protein